MFLKLISSVIVIFILKLVLNYLLYWTNIRKIPGPGGFPFLGNFKHFNSKGFVQYLLRAFEGAKYGTFKYTIGNKAFVVLTEPETISCLLLSKCVTESVRSEDFHRTKNLLELEPKITVPNKELRQFVCSLTDLNIRKFVQIFNETTNKFVKNVEKSTPVDIQSKSITLSFSIFCEYFLGISGESNERTTKVIHSILRLEEIQRRRSISIIHDSDLVHELTSLYKEEQKCISNIHEFCEDIVKSRKYTLAAEEDSKKEKCPLDVLLCHNNQNSAVKEQIVNAMFFNVGPTSAAITFTLYCLASNPEIQRKVLQEQREILKGDEEPNLPQLKSMKYLENVLKEALRLYSPMPFVARNLVNNIKTPDGFQIPSGTNVVASFFALGRNPKTFKDPLKFDPERPYPDYESLLETVLTPFSVGSRNCAGNKIALALIKSVISRIVRSSEFSLDSGTSSELQLEAGSFLRSSSPINLVFKNR